MSETAVTQPAKAKKEITYTPVKMSDGSTVSFPGSQKVKKSVLEDAGVPVGIRFDISNGDVHVLHLSDLQDATVRYAACHGLNQKVGDEFAGAKDASGNPATADDISLMVEEMMNRLRRDEWFTERAAGDSMAGASIVIRAIIEDKARQGVVKTVAEIKDFLRRKVEGGKAEGLTYQKLYKSFRSPGSRTAAIIRRLEDEAAAKSSSVDANALLDEVA